jgi:hypothetical protein
MSGPALDLHLLAWGHFLLGIGVLVAGIALACRRK